MDARTPAHDPDDYREMSLWNATDADFEDERILGAAQPRLVCFAGRAGVGKSEASGLLISHGFVPVKFAAPLKSMLTTMYEFAGLDADEIAERIEGALKEKPDPVLGGTSPRRAMQTLGGEWGRDMVREDLWVSLWSKTVRRKLAAGFSVVVDDLRYPNEADAIRELGGQVFMIEGPSRRIVPQHASERFDFDPDEIIHNNDDLASFRHRVLDACGIA